MYLNKSNIFYIFQYLLRVLSILYIIWVSLFFIMPYVFAPLYFMSMKFPRVALFSYEYDFSIFDFLIFYYHTLFGIFIAQIPGWIMLLVSYLWEIKNKKPKKLNLAMWLKLLHFTMWLRSIGWVYLIYTATVNTLAYIHIAISNIKQEYIYIGHNSEYSMHYLFPWVGFYISTLAPGIIILWAYHHIKRKRELDFYWSNFIAKIYLVISASISLSFYLHIFVKPGFSLEMFLSFFNLDPQIYHWQILGVFVLVQAPAWLLLWWCRNKAKKG